MGKSKKISDNLDKLFLDPLWSRLVCPICNSPLFINEDILYCKSCKNEYPYSAVHDVIDFLLMSKKHGKKHGKKKGNHIEAFSYIFMFSWSFKRTDIQYGELVNLIKKYVDTKNKDVEPDIQTYKDDFKIDNNENYFNPPKKTKIKRGKIFIQKFGQSCIVWSSYKLDLKGIIDDSGYIYSCGKLVYSSIWDLANEDDIVLALTNYISQSKDRKYNLCFLTKNKNNSSDREKEFVGKSFLDKQLDLQIDEERYFLGRQLFTQSKHFIKGKIKDEINVVKDCNKADIMAYKDNRLSIRDGKYESIWEQRKMYFIIFHLLHIKKNPLHELDENKPYNKGSYTTPAKLMRAMLNLASVKETDIVLDPFSYTGTLALEMVDFRGQVISGENDEAIGLSDNLNFLTSAPNGHDFL